MRIDAAGTSAPPTTVRSTELWSTAARPDEAGDGSVPNAPAALLKELGATRVTPLSHGGNSGAALLRAESDGTDFILKRVGGGGSDWLARATGDEGRTAQLYEAGAFDRMPESIGHGIVAVEREGDAAWVAMRDVGSLLLPGAARLSREDSRRILAAAADLHREFRGEAPPGAATLAARIGMSSPAIGEAERNQPDLLPKQFEQGWDAFGELVSDDVADVVLALASDVRQLADALVGAYGGATLIHGDLRGDNLGFDGERLVLIDWDLAAAGTPGAEFAWYLAHSARRIDASHDEIELDHVAAQAEDHLPARARAGHGVRASSSTAGGSLIALASIRTPPRRCGAEPNWIGGSREFGLRSSVREAGSRPEYAGRAHATALRGILHA